MSEIVLCEIQDGIATVKLNRPETLNALNRQLLEELDNVFTGLGKNSGVRVIILSGEGRSFAAGADLAYMKDLSPREAAEFSMLGQRVFNRIEEMNKIVIVAIRGYALGGGCELAMACDIRVGSVSAQMGLPEVTLGLIPGFGGTQRLPRIVGLSIAKEMVVTGRRVPADEAKSIGLLNYVADDEQLIGFCTDLAGKIAANSVTAIELCKRCMNAGIEMDISKAMDFEAGMFGLNMSNPDAQIGITAFLAKQKPVFKNQDLF